MKIGNLEINNLSTKIKKENIYIGNIKRCTKYREIDMPENLKTNSYVVFNSETYAKNVILVKVSDNPVGYINLRSFESLIDYLKENDIKDFNGQDLKDMILYTKTTGLQLGSIWVDSISLRPYYKKEKGKVKVRKIKEV